MSVLFDTSIVIDLLRGRPEAVAYLEDVMVTPTCSEITRVEIIQGMRSTDERRTYALLDALNWRPCDRNIAARAGLLGRSSRASHQGIGVADLIIGATALEHGLELVTLNVRHFPMFPKLRPPF